jgi:DNA-binding MarR family transcriptional regulator
MTDRSRALMAADTGALLGATTRAVVALHSPHLAPLELTHPEYLVMLILADKEQRSVVEIARTLFLSPATVSPLLTRLEASGYVRRVRDDTDARRFAVTLTATGITLLPRLAGIGEAVNGQIRIPPHDGETLRRFITALTAASRDMPPRPLTNEPDTVVAP